MRKAGKSGFGVIKPHFGAARADVVGPAERGAEDEEEEKGEFDLDPPLCSQVF